MIRYQCRQCGTSFDGDIFNITKEECPKCHSRDLYNLTGSEVNTMQGVIAKDDMVNHPPHYKNHPSGVECITITRHFNFNKGNAIKYIWRSGEKENEIEDLKKAVWYLNDEIKRLESSGFINTKLPEEV